MKRETMIQRMTLATALLTVRDLATQCVFC